LRFLEIDASPPRFFAISSFLAKANLPPFSPRDRRHPPTFALKKGIFAVSWEKRLTCAAATVKIEKSGSNFDFARCLIRVVSPFAATRFVDCYNFQL